MTVRATAASPSFLTLSAVETGCCMSRNGSQEIRFWENPNGTLETKLKYTDYTDFTLADRKRNHAQTSIDSDFIQFLEGAGLLETSYNDAALEALLEPYPMINDLPGAPWYDAMEEGKVPAANPRAVVTAGPGLARDTDETNSAATMPMPKKRRLNDDDEVTSHNNGSPNDLVEVPSVVAVSQPSAAAAPSASSPPVQPQPPKASVQATSATTAVQQPAVKAAEGKQVAAAAAASPAPSAVAAVAPAASSVSVVKAVLVAKVLTKSDANSKRVILPRIAIEANLPQLASSQQTFNFRAQDGTGHTWPLCIKAWANGQNPKPVYVLEQVGEIMKQEKLTAGDALAVLASQDGRFFIEWNTEQARTAAARPTYSAFTFTAAAAQVNPAAADTAAVGPDPSSAAVTMEEHGQTGGAPMSSPVASGPFMPGSPCQLLVMGHPTMTKDSYLQLDETQELTGSATAAPPAAAGPVAPTAPQSPAGSAAGAAAAVPAVVQPSPSVGVNGTLHQGGFLVCPRTPGCTRPAGHQGWCLGHKGFKKRRG